MYLYRRILVLSLLMMSVGWGQEFEDEVLKYDILNADNLDKYEADEINENTVRDLGDVIAQIDLPFHASGLTFDGTYLWILSELNSTVYQIDPSSGDIISEIYLSFLNGNGWGIEWDGEYFWISEYNPDTIFKLDSEFNLLDSFSLSVNIDGLTWDGEFLWTQSAPDGKIYKIDVFSQSVIEEFSVLPNNFGLGIAFDGEGLWITDSWYYVSDIPVYQVSVNDGTTIQSFQFLSGECSKGITFDGQYLWVGACNNTQLFKIDIGYEGSDSGCTDSYACNYDPDAEEDDGSCEYPEGTCDCDGPIEDYCDCDGNMIDECGECGGDGYPCDEELVFYNILVFEDSPEYPYNGYEHLIFPNINLSIDSLVFVNNEYTFEQKITDGTNWDMVLYNKIMYSNLYSNFVFMSDYINNGGKLIYNNWTAGEYDNTLLENLGVVVTANFTTPINFEAEPSSSDHPIFNTPNQISNLYWNDDNAIVDGQYVSLINNSSALAVFEDYSDPAIILNEDNNAFFNAFSFTQYLDNDNDFDGVSDIFELIENQILFLLDSNNNFVLGDLNGDGEVNIYDIIILVSLVFDGEYNESGDVNGDGILNIADCILLVNLILGN